MEIDSPVSPEWKGKCPSCGMVVMTKPQFNHPGYRIELQREDLPNADGYFARAIQYGQCLNCDELIIDLVDMRFFDTGVGTESKIEKAVRLYPTNDVAARPAPPEDVPENLRQAFDEASKVAPVSRLGAAILGRRCLQMLLRHLGFEAGTLDREIDLAMADDRISRSLHQKFHIVRVVGNYAAHPTTDGAGNQLSVEPGELDALFGVLEEAFEEFFVKPKRTERLVESVNAKLKSAGKPLLPALLGEQKKSA